MEALNQKERKFMDRRAIVERLEDLRDHCRSMIDKDDPTSIWWGDTEALTEAIKALSLDIDKNQKGDMDMMSKVKVTIVAHDGTTKEITGDTAICFTVSKAAEFLSGKAKIIDANEAFVGHDIPDPLFAVTMGSLVGSLIKARQKERPMVAAFTLHEVSLILEAESKELASGASDHQKEAELQKAIEELLKATFTR